MNHNISVQSKTGQEFFCKLKCNYCLLGDWEWLFFAHYATLQDLKKLFRISLFPIKEVIRSYINGYCLSRSTILISYTPIVVQKSGLIVTPSCLSAFLRVIRGCILQTLSWCRKYLEMSSDFIHNTWRLREVVEEAPVTPFLCGFN